MKKKNVILISALVLLSIGLLALYLFVIKKKPDQPKEEQPGFFTICQVDAQRINRIHLKTKTFEGSFSKESDTWVRDDEDVFPVRQAALNLIVTVIASNMRAFEKLENPVDLAQYGLEEPSADVCMYAGDELLVRICVGDKLLTDDRYYIKVEGDDNIYIASENYHEYLVKERYDFLDTIQLPQIADNALVREILISGKNIQTIHAIQDKKNPYDYSALGLFTWYFEEPYKGHVNANFQSDTWDFILTRFTALTYKRLIAFRSQNDAEYGLDDPDTTIYVRYADASREDYSYTLYLGKRTEEGTYARIKGNDWFFLMDNDIVSYMLGFDVFANTYKTTFYPNNGAINRVTITASGKEWIMQNLFTGKDVAEYSINGKKLSDDALSAWNTKVLQLKYSGIASTEEHGEEILSITVEVNEPDVLKGMEFKFYVYNPSVYLVSVDGVFDFTIDVRDVDDFIEFMKVLE